MSESNIDNKNSSLVESFNLSYTVVGDGKESRIVPLQPRALSVTGDCIFGLNDSVASFANDDTSECWRCNLCSYVNADGGSRTCSVCGAEREDFNEGEAVKESPTMLKHFELKDAPEPEIIHDSNNDYGVNIQQDCNASKDEMADEDKKPPSKKHIEDSKNSEPKISTEESQSRVSEYIDDNYFEYSAHSRGAESLDNPFSAHGRKGSMDSRDQYSSSSFRNLMYMSYAKWSENDNKPWHCATCTYLNIDPRHLICAVCSQPRSDRSAWNDEAVEDEQDETLEERKAKFLALEEKALEKERADELIKEQARIMAEIAEQNRPRDLDTTVKIGTAELNELQGEEANLDSREIRRRLEEATEALECMQKILDEDKQEQEAFEATQKQRFEEVEEEVLLVIGRDPSDDQNDTFGPGTSQSEALEWIAQQRMLEEWRTMTTRKQEEIEILRQEKERLLQQYNSQSSSETDN